VGAIVASRMVKFLVAYAGGSMAVLQFLDSPAGWRRAPSPPRWASPAA
jgi:hypothetical protein